MRCKKREFQGPFLSNPVLSKIFFMGPWLFSFSASLPERKFNVEQPSSSMCFFPWGNFFACTFFPRGTDKVTTPVPQKNGNIFWYHQQGTTLRTTLDWFSTTWKKPCWHLVSTTKTSNPPGPPVAWSVDPNRCQPWAAMLWNHPVFEEYRNHTPTSVSLLDRMDSSTMFFWLGLVSANMAEIYIIFPGKELIHIPTLGKKGTYHLQMWLLMGYMFAPRRVCHRKIQRNIVCWFWRGATCVKNVSIDVSILKGGQLKQIHDEWLIRWSCHHHHLAKTDDIHETRSLAKVFG